MELHHVKTEIEIGNVAKSTGFSIQLDAHTARLLNDPYTDKIAAVVREIICNALDAALTTGKPITVHLPNSLEPWFAVTDDGTGIGPDGMQEGYTRYGHSSKRKDIVAIGCFGIGRFSALSYGGSFSIIDRHRPTNTKTFYTVAKNEDGIPELHTNNTAVLQPHEVSGFEVRVPVKAEDFGTFKDRVTKFLANVEVPVNVSGARVEIEKRKPVLQSPTGKWRIFHGDHYNGVITAAMGPVRYKIDLDKIGLEWAIKNKLNHLTAEFTFGMGEVMTTISREELSYTPQTIARVKQAIDDLIAELKIQAQAELDKVPTLWQARKKIKDLFSIGTIRELVGQTFIWKGSHRLTGSYFTMSGKVLGHNPFAQISKHKLGLVNMPFAWVNEVGFNAGDDVSIVIDDTETLKPKPNIRKIIKLNYGGGSSEVVVIRPAGPGQLAEILKEIGDPPTELASQLDQPEVDAYGSLVKAPKKPVKMKEWDSTTGAWKDASVIVADGGIYVNMHSGDVKSPIDWANAWRLAGELGLTNGQRLIGVQATVASPEKMAALPNWTLIEKYLEEKLISYTKADEIDVLWPTYLAHSASQSWVDNVISNAGNDFFDGITSGNSPFKTLREFRFRTRHRKFQTVGQLAEVLKLTTLLQKTGKLRPDWLALVASLVKKHPMLALVQLHSYRGDSLKTILTYVNR
jgi:hypothetical protein